MWNKTLWTTIVFASAWAGLLACSGDDTTGPGAQADSGADGTMAAEAGPEASPGMDGGDAAAPDAPSEAAEAAASEGGEAGLPEASSEAGDAAGTDGGDGSAEGGDTSVDGGVADASEGGIATEAGGGYEGGLGSSCIAALYGTYVLRTDGVLIWENNASSPETIIDDSTGFPLKGVVNVGVGVVHACAALSNGSVKCWQVESGGNASGQLGNGTTTASSSLYRATQVLTAANTPLSGVVAVATMDSWSSNTSCAVRSDGKLYCWGDLTWIVNNGTALLTGYAQAITTDGSTPLTGVTQAVIGPLSACALVVGDAGLSNGVWCWGYNSLGELGLGDQNKRQYPTHVGGLISPTKLAIDSSAGNYQIVTVCAQDGTNVRCWGANPNGAAGTNTTTNPILSPTAVVTMNGALLDQVSDLQTGVDAFGVLRNDGTIWAWGGGSYFAKNYGLTNVVSLGWVGPTNGPRYVTSDGVYHSAMTNVTVNCNAM